MSESTKAQPISSSSPHVHDVVCLWYMTIPPWVRVCGDSYHHRAHRTGQWGILHTSFFSVYPTPRHVIHPEPCLRVLCLRTGPSALRSSGGMSSNFTTGLPPLSWPKPLHVVHTFFIATSLSAGARCHTMPFGTWKSAHQCTTWTSTRGTGHARVP